MRKLLHKLTNNKSAIVIVAIVFLLAITNYVPNTFLTGWDNLQTDLAPWLGVKRAFWAVWEEYQSFGLTSGYGSCCRFTSSIVHMAVVFCFTTTPSSLRVPIYNDWFGWAWYASASYVYRL
jgi:hypothetical protein